MKDDDLKEFANQFIQSWQENFAKLGADQHLMEVFAGNMYNVQQFYDKSNAATASRAYQPGVDEPNWREFERRLNAIEQKLEGFGKDKRENKKPGAR